MENRSQERKKEKIESSNEVLAEVGEAGEKIEEFIESYCNLISTGDWRYSLTVKEILQLIVRERMREKEITNICVITF